MVYILGGFFYMTLWIYPFVFSMGNSIMFMASILSCSLICAYKSIVIAMFACPMISFKVFGGTP